jgi:hypothetical protein
MDHRPETILTLPVTLLVVHVVLALAPVMFLPLCLFHWRRPPRCERCAS